MIPSIISEKLMLFGQKQKEKKNNKERNTINSSAVHGRRNRFLIIVNVLGGSGPIKFVVKEDDSVAGVIGTALKLYAREERLPVLGYDVNQCLLYPSNGGQEAALGPSEMIAAGGGRNFLLCKKQSHQEMADDAIMRSPKNRCWKTFLIKPLRKIKSFVRTRY
ncbi:Senescence-associated protein [Heracleum sosnowskyi]|uniref:Senescence-associated protein n=1 Tax=Heracleum sosnowskyi TaxID=360622 RepID=A0AAD8IFU7_9APIA|nr:Senescence-associated protein [Heracleum sosnowskyi]